MKSAVSEMLRDPLGSLQGLVAVGIGAMRKIYSVALVALSALVNQPLVGQGLDLNSLDEMYGSGDRLKDPVEIEYLLHRCTSMYSVLFVKYERETVIRRQEGDERWNDFHKTAFYFSQNQLYFYEASVNFLPVTKRSQDSLQGRILVLSKEYAELYGRNFAIHNIGIYGKILSDLKFCKTIRDSGVLQGKLVN